MKGFFNIETDPFVRGKRVEDCYSCRLKNKAQSPKMSCTGDGRSNALVLGEAPGEEEDLRNIQFVGRAGQLLRFHLSKHKLSLDRDFWKQNVVNCRPTDSKGNNRTPTVREIETCRHTWVRTVEELKPKYIMLFGDSAVRAFFMDRGHEVRKNLSIGRWRAFCIPDIKRGAWILPLYHPSFALRNPNAEGVFSADLSKALDHVRSDYSRPKPENWAKRVTMLWDFEDVIGGIKNLHSARNVIFDYETNALRPYRKGTKVVWIGVSPDPDYAFSFPLAYRSHWNEEQLRRIIEEWQGFLLDANVSKGSHSNAMEELWNRGYFGVKAEGWIEDSMVTAHVLDERPGITSLDFQVFSHWGYEYGENIASFKRDRGDGFNRIEEAPPEELGEYCGQDALFGHMLYLVQTNELHDDKYKLIPADDLFFEGIHTFINMTYTGIWVDEGYYHKKYDELSEEITDLEAQLMSSKEAILFKKHRGKEVNLRSNSKDLQTLFFKLLKYKPLSLTDKGNPQLNEETLGTWNTPFSDGIVKLRKLYKNRDTYIVAYMNSVDGKLRPNFNLHLVRSYRSSCDDPNLQNAPRRDEEAKKLCRSGIIAPPGYKIGASDYGSHEMRIAACLSGDQQLIEDLMTPGYKIHKVWADELGISYDSGKNGFVFPQVYGSFYKTIYRELKAEGYSKLTERMVQEAEEAFWGRYKRLRQWQEEMLESYKRNGFIEMPWGFRRGGYLERNKIFNTPIQAAAFHCLLWSCNKLDKLRIEEEWKTLMSAQIHDEIFWYIWPDEESYIMETGSKVMSEDIMKDNPWVIMPLLAEWKLGRVGGSWYDVKEVQ